MANVSWKRAQRSETDKQSGLFESRDKWESKSWYPNLLLFLCVVLFVNIWHCCWCDKVAKLKEEEKDNDPKNMFKKFDSAGPMKVLSILDVKLDSFWHSTSGSSPTIKEQPESVRRIQKEAEGEGPIRVVFDTVIWCSIRRSKAYKFYHNTSIQSKEEKELKELQELEEKNQWLRAEEELVRLFCYIIIQTPGS